MCLLRQIFHEAIDGVAVVLAEQFCIRPFLGGKCGRESESSEQTLIASCEQEHLTFTRGRPSLKNDQCFVEQKNGAIVRHVVGYDRLVGEQAIGNLLNSTGRCACMSTVFSLR
jgi:hypothetical protein